MGILWFIVAVIVAFWLVGLLTNIVGGLIHLLLVLVVALIIYNLVFSRRGNIRM